MDTRAQDFKDDLETGDDDYEIDDVPDAAKVCFSMLEEALRNDL